MFDGRVFVFGLKGERYIDTPGPTAADPGTWVLGLAMPNGDEAEDEYTNVLANAKVMGQQHKNNRKDTMEFNDLLKQRRSLRSFVLVEIGDTLIRDLAAAASRAPSCSNKQPWRFVFARSKDALERLVGVLAPGNAFWAKHASMIVAVWSQADLDCRTPDGRDYYQFDTGMATALLLLAATERKLVTHPLAGFDAQAARNVLALPAGGQVITLIIVGGPAQAISPDLKDWQIRAETEPSTRIPFEEFATIM